MDARKLKTDMMKIGKISTEFNVYYAQYDTLPGITNQTTGKMTAKTIYDELTPKGILKDNDFKMKSVTGSYWQFNGCKEAVDPSGAVTFYGNSKNLRPMPSLHLPIR